MNKTDLGQTIQIFANVGVIAGIVFLAIELRQNDEQLEIQSYQAWGATRGDDSIWPVVALIIRLPGLDETAYQSLRDSAEGHGHHAQDAADDEHSHEESDESTGYAAHDHGGSEDHEPDEAAQPEAPEEHDHSTHEHNR